jgi:hypothetical protein
MSATATCPSWCESKGLDDGGTHDGPVWPRVKTTNDNGYGVTISAGWSSPDVWAGRAGFGISIDQMGASLTPKQARKVARRLHEAAAWVEAHRAAKV